MLRSQRILTPLYDAISRQAVLAAAAPRLAGFLGFAAQQSAEKAVKALHLVLGQDVWGHVVAQLLRDLPRAVPAELIDKARGLDNFYIATRYANGHPAGAPFEHYGQLQSGQAIAYAGEILDYSRSEMARPRGG